MTRLAACGLGLALLAAGAAGAAGVGVAPFETVAAAGQVAPDVAAHVAQRLATRGVGAVVGPQELGAPATFEPRPAEARSWAQRAAVDAIVVGRTTKLGSRLSLHARLLDGSSGQPVGAPVVEEVARPEELGRSIDRLTGALLDRLGERPGAVSARPGAVGPSAGAVSAPGPEKQAEKPRDGLRFDRSQPLSIHSDQLEAAPDPSGQRRLVFAGHVRAEQGDFSLAADRLEALYLAGASEPHRLQAKGHVTLKQGARLARCAEATFFRAEERVVCTGQLAELEQACDRVRGSRIVFHLGSERLEVEGGADVSLRPEGPGCGQSALGGGPSP
jgi:lipopolysaccharide transport protein LptA